jgi:hypothetical protein
VQVEMLDRQKDVVCWCDWPAEAILGLKFNTPCHLDGFERTGDPHVDGVRWVPRGQPSADGPSRVRVLLHGDLIADKDGRGVDGNHLPLWLPARRSGDGVEGGLFESWFTVDFSQG